jgi:hypothetical protein
VTSADEYLKTNPFFIPALWLLLGLAADLGWSVWARRKLLTEFRPAASDRFHRSGSAGKWCWTALFSSSSAAPLAPNHPAHLTGMR